LTINNKNKNNLHKHHSFDDSRSPDVKVVLVAKKNPMNIAPRIKPKQTLGEKIAPIRKGIQIS
jgi:hypothetical protein